MTTNFDLSQVVQQIELDLLDTIAIPNLPYVWNVMETEESDYFGNLEQGFNLEDLPEDLITTGSNKFFAQLDNLWSIHHLQSSLWEKFAHQVPQFILDRLAEITLAIHHQTTQAQTQLSTLNADMMTQLVDSVRELLPQWQSEDLQLIARPLVYAMRSNPSTEPIATTTTWEELSELEQARLSMAIAHFALVKLQEVEMVNT